LVQRGTEPRDGELIIQGFDQKPLWCTSASAEKTYDMRGKAKVAVKENVPLSRSRFTVMTRCAWPDPPSDGKDIAVLFKASGGGVRIRPGLHPPPGVLLQFQEKGSYRLADVLEYMEWILDRSRMGAAEDEVLHDDNGPPLEDEVLQDDNSPPLEDDTLYDDDRPPLENVTLHEDNRQLEEDTLLDVNRTPEEDETLHDDMRLQEDHTLCDNSRPSEQLGPPCPRCRRGAKSGCIPPPIR
jgi:hypothetical protein